MKQATKPIEIIAKSNQTPFDRFKDALSIVASVPRSSLPKSTKKPRKK